MSEDEGKKSTTVLGGYPHKGRSRRWLCEQGGVDTQLVYWQEVEVDEFTKSPRKCFLEITERPLEFK